MKKLENHEVAGTEGLSLLVIAGAALLLLGSITAPGMATDVAKAKPLVETVSIHTDAGVS